MEASIEKDSNLNQDTMAGKENYSKYFEWIMYSTEFTVSFVHHSLLLNTPIIIILHSYLWYILSNFIYLAQYWMCSVLYNKI